MSGTDVAAWWGAVIATAVLIWDIYKWRTAGPRIALDVRSGMKFLNDPSGKDDFFITVRVTNTGDRPTTITNMGFAYYSSFVRYLLKKPTKAVTIFRPGTPHQLPHILKPGDIWDGAAEQDAEMEQWARDGYLLCLIYHSARTKPLEARVKVRDSKLTSNSSWRSSASSGTS